MANKTILEKQMQTYGQFQSVLRKMSKEDQVRYASEGPLAEQREREQRDLENRRTAYRKELAAFDREKPTFGNLFGLSIEDAQKIATINKEWAQKRKRFDADLREKYRMD